MSAKQPWAAYRTIVEPCAQLQPHLMHNLRSGHMRWTRTFSSRARQVLRNPSRSHDAPRQVRTAISNIRSHQSRESKTPCFSTYSRRRQPSVTGPGPDPHGSGSPRSAHASALLGLGLAFLGCAVYASRAREVLAEAQGNPKESSEEIEPARKLIRLSEIRKHGPKAEEPWIIHKTGVYDITDWIGAHPGGNVILRAAGDSVDPYWDIFTLHKKKDVYDILEQYRIGDVDPQDLVDGKMPATEIKDPFVDDPERDKRLITHTEKPRNAETPKDQLQEFITPMNTFYVRNHLWVPRVDEGDHGLTIDLGDGEDEKVYSMHDLKTKFKQHTITATLQCSGNRRKHMSEAAHATSGLPWDVGAISNAEWSGPRLKDVLRHAGFDISNQEDLRHAQFTGEDGYGASIPLQKAMDPYGDVILACQMNGRALPRDHGFPVRVLVPGNVAARSVKFVNRITLSEEESTSQWQRKDYKCFGPNCQQMHAHWDDAPAIQETPVQSAITSVTKPNGGTEGMEIQGYAFSGGGRAIARVDISLDGGETWDQAKMLRDEAKGSKRWSWQLWRYEAGKSGTGNGKTSGRMNGPILVKAVDEAYNMQPEEHGPTWNFRGNLTTAWHRVGLDGKTACAEKKKQEGGRGQGQ